MVAGIDQWNVSAPDLHEPRLEKQLHVSGFVSPPASERGADVPVVRFPFWYSCPNCRRLDRHSFFTSREGTNCNTCGVRLIPSRFVVACRRGHIDDFPYFAWVHAGSQASGNAHALRIESTGATASLRDIVISCECGVDPITMEGAFNASALRGLATCKGTRPWLLSNEDCAETPRTLQRGASSVWFSIVQSALSIPPWSEGAYRTLNRDWKVLRYLAEDAVRTYITSSGLADGSGFSVDALVAAWAERLGKQTSATSSDDAESIRRDEFAALVLGKSEQSPEQDFVAVAADAGHEGARWFDRIMRVARLREVRALQSFTRLEPPDATTKPEERAPLAVDEVDWLPAIDVRGEGLFLRLEEERLSAWESRESVRSRAATIDASYRAHAQSQGVAPDREVTPRLLLLHTLAHVLINQLALDSGYPSASLRERVYSSPEMRGLLIYTATSDSAGSLGGLVSQAEPERLDSALLEAIGHAAWCSSDPLCIESTAAGVDSLNLAACHACVLLPETSCEEMNVLLDRGMLVGTPDDPGLGFFSDLLTGV